MHAHRIRQNGAVLLQEINGVSDLIDLQRSVGQQGRVAHAEADDLNSVLNAQRVPDQDHLVDKGKDEKGEEGRDRLVLRVEVVVVEFEARFNAELEPCEDISVIGRQLASCKGWHWPDWSE